jgi:predicted double-glycine peptidase
VATLITGIIENSSVTEIDVVNKITTDKNEEETGYLAEDLAKAANKLGYYAEWHKISSMELPKIKRPVLLLIGLNSEFPHYVVLKGVQNNEAYLADPIRGNIRIPYAQLVQESINEKFKQWLVMVIEPSANKPKDSTLYLSDNESERHAHHVTVDQSNAITLATLSKENQFIIDYDFSASVSNDKVELIKTNSQNYVHRLNARYGITDQLQIGGSIQYTDNQTQFAFENNKAKFNDTDRAYSLYINNRFKLDDSGQHNIILGINGSYAEKNDVFGAGFNLTAYSNTEFAQLLAGGAINKDFSHNQPINSVLPEYRYSVFIGANKPLGDKYLGSLNLSLSDAQAKNDWMKFKPTYSVSTGLTYVLSKHFQLSPSFSYSFGQGDVFSFGMNIAYIGSW